MEPGIEPQAEIVFNAVVVMAFLGQIFNYWLIGRGVINRYLFIFVLTCFTVTEAMLAVDRPAMLLYVLLNLWGLLQLLRRPKHGT